MPPGRAGAELLLIWTNTMRRLAPAVEARVRIPFFTSITAERTQAAELRTVGLLGTAFTMEQAS